MQEIILSLIKDAPWPAAAVLIAAVGGLALIGISAGVTKRQKLKARQAETEKEQKRIEYLYRVATPDSGVKTIS